MIPLVNITLTHSDLHAHPFMTELLFPGSTSQIQEEEECVHEEDLSSDNKVVLFHRLIPYGSCTIKFMVSVITYSTLCEKNAEVAKLYEI